MSGGGPKPPPAAANDGPARDAAVAFWVTEIEAAIAAGELACECGALLALADQPDGARLIVCSASCSGPSTFR